jgi:hypothetical protein
MQAPCSEIYNYVFPSPFWGIGIFIGVIAAGLTLWELHEPHPTRWVAKLRLGLFIVFGLFGALPSLAELVHHLDVRHTSAKREEGVITRLVDDGVQLGLPVNYGEFCLDSVCFQFPRRMAHAGFIGLVPTASGNVAAEVVLAQGDSIELLITDDRRILSVRKCQ